VSPISPSDPGYARAVRRGLVVLTLVNLFNYLDRYVVSALVETLKNKPDAVGKRPGLGLSDTEAGFLPTAFILVYMATSGVFGSLGDRLSRPRLIAIGVAIWSLATAMGGLAGGFVSLLAARALVGVGEGAYGTIAPGLLADYYPKRVRGRVMAIFFAAIPVGAALGFIVGGWADSRYGWRAAFYISGLPGLLLALFALRIPDPPRGCQDDDADRRAAPSGRSRGLAAYGPLLRVRPFVWAVAGYAAATFAAGGLAYWMPAFLERVRGADHHEATLQFGVVTVVTGLVGTAVGGVLGDRLLKKTRHAYLWFSGVSTLAAVPFVWLALTLESPPLYLGAIVLGELMLFASTGPINSAIVNSVPAERRATAVAFSILAIHLLGDVPSPPLIGWVSDMLRGGADSSAETPAQAAKTLGRAVLMVPVAVAVAGALWTYAAWRAERADRRARATAP